MGPNPPDFKKRPTLRVLDVEQRGPVAGRMIQCEPQTPQDVLVAVLVHHTHPLLGDVTRRGTIVRVQRT
jgi:hypothetical protein